MGNRKLWMVALTASMGFSLSGCVRSCAWSSTVPAETTVSPGPVGLNSGRSSLPLLNLNRSGRLPQQWRPSEPEREWNSIVIHHTATDRGNVDSIHEVHRRRKDSKGNPWLGIGYHFVIGNGNGMGDGTVEPTFRWRQQLHGAHAGNNQYNQHGIGIALIGNFEKKPPTAAQMASVKRLIGALKATYRISSEKVIGHGDIKATACPGKFFPMAEVSLSDPGLLLGQRVTPPNSFNLISF